MSQRVEKVESVVRQVVAAELINELGSAGAGVTVTAVDVSPDLRQATVWLGVVTGDPEAIMEQVQAARRAVQAKLAATLTTKFVPRLQFQLDQGGQYADHISRILHDLD